MSQAGSLSNTSGGSGIETINSIGPTGGGNFTLIPGSGISLTPGTNSITISSIISANKFPITPFVVGPLGNAGYQTIQSALDAANASGGGVVYVQPGTYPENLVFYPTTQIVGTTGSSYGAVTGGTIQIIGVHTPPVIGYIACNNIYFISATDVFFSAAAGSASIVIENCEINVDSGFTFNLPNWTGLLGKFAIQEGSSSNGVVNNSGGAMVFFQQTNVGAGGALMVTSGPTFLYQCNISCPWTMENGTVVDSRRTSFGDTVTAQDVSSGNFESTNFVAGGDAAFFMSSTSNFTFTNCVFDSTNSPAIDGSGSGTLTFCNATFPNNAIIAATLTTVGTGSFIPGNFGSIGQVFTSNGPGVVPSFQAGGSGITTINGDTGSVTGSTITTTMGTTNGTARFSGSGTTLTLNASDALSNTGFGSGALELITVGTYNSAFGQNALNQVTSGEQNSAFGNAASYGRYTGDSNCAFGSQALYVDNSGSRNTAIGVAAVAILNGGSSNTGIGYWAGYSYASNESNNICIGDSVVGVIGESNTTRIGLQGTQTDCYIGGINGATPSATALVATSDTNGRLATIASSGNIGYVLTDNGPAASPTFQSPNIGSGSLILLQTHTANNDTSLLFSSISNVYTNFLLIGNCSVTTLSLNNSIDIQFSIDNGLTFISTGYVNSTANTSGCQIFNYNAAMIQSQVNCSIYNLYSAINYISTANTSVQNSSGPVVSGGTSLSFLNSLQSVNAFQILSEIGDSFSGTFSLYGYAQ